MTRTARVCRTKPHNSMRCYPAGTCSPSYTARRQLATRARCSDTNERAAAMRAASLLSAFCAVHGSGKRSPGSATAGASRPTSGLQSPTRVAEVAHRGRRPDIRSPTPQKGVADHFSGSATRSATRRPGRRLGDRSLADRLLRFLTRSKVLPRHSRRDLCSVRPAIRGWQNRAVTP